MKQLKTNKTIKTFLLVNQSTTYLFRSLAERLACNSIGDFITLLSGSVEADDPNKLPFKVVISSPLVRSPGWKRIFTWSIFTLRFVMQLLMHRPDLAVLTTNPPFVPWAAGLLHFFLRIRYIVIVYDVYPDALKRMGYLRKNSIAYRLFRRLSAISLRRASAVVTLGEDMAKHIEMHDPQHPPAIEIIPNWADTEIYRPVSKFENSFAIEHGLVDKFVVMYSGAFGATHDINTILSAASEIVDLSKVVFVLIGKGTRLEDTRQLVEQMNLPNVMLLPWQPLSVTPLSLAAADCHIVTLDSAYAGISFPSKFYTSLSVGAAILALAPDKTDLYNAVLKLQVGFPVKPGYPNELSERIRELALNQKETSAMARRSRIAAERYYDEIRCTGLYSTLIKRVLTHEKNA